MQESETDLKTVPMKRKYILCKYSEYQNGEIMLVKIREFPSEERAVEYAAAFSQHNNERIVMLTELVTPSSHWL